METQNSEGKSPSNGGKFIFWLNRQENITRPEKKALTRISCTLYCLLMCMFGVVFPIADTLTNTGLDLGYYTEVYQLILFLSATVIILYIFLDIVRKIKSAPTTGKKSRDSAAVAFKMNSETSCQDQMWVNAYFGAEGTNLYFRIGGVGFAVGTCVFCLLRLLSAHEGPISPACHPALKQVVDVFMMIFVIIQAVLFVKYQKLIVNQRKPMFRFFMMHLMATNLALWLSATTHEISEDVGKKLHEISVQRNESFPQIDGCHHKETSYDLVSRYIYPCVIEYALFGAGAAFVLYLNIGKGNIVKRPENYKKVKKNIHHKCHRAYPGLVFGVVLVIATVASIVIFFNIKDGEFLFMAIELSLCVVSIVAAVFCYLFLRNLKYVGVEEDNFDGTLLLITQTGVYIFGTFMVLGGIHALYVGKYVEYGAFFFCEGLMHLAQSSLQSYLILDGFGRMAHMEEHRENKPGQSIITVLLMANLSMWLTSTFLLGEADDIELFRDYYGNISWSMIMRLFSPLLIFYRFHSSVCLSDIWNSAYKIRNLDSYG